MSSTITGEIKLLASTIIPDGWLACDGQIVNIVDYPDLFGVLSTTFGGDGVTEFALPDFRGRVPIHIGQGGSLTNRSLGDSGGEEGVILDDTQIPAHNHSLMVGAEDKGGVAVDTAAGNYLGNSVSTYRTTGGGSSLNALSIEDSGGGLSHNNMPPFLAVSYIIAVKGVLPENWETK